MSNLFSKINYLQVSSVSIFYLKILIIIQYIFPPEKYTYHQLEYSITIELPPMCVKYFLLFSILENHPPFTQNPASNYPLIPPHG